MPILGKVHPEPRQSVGTIIQRARNNGHIIDYREARGDSLISRARQNIMNQFLKEDYDYLMFVDDDIVWHPKTPEDSLIDTFINHKKDIISALYVIRGFPHNQTCRLIDDVPNPDFRKAEDLIQIRYAATGCTLYSKRVLEDLGKSYIYPFQPFVYEGEYLSEDWALCQRAIDRGYTIWLDTTIQLGHIGSYEYSLKDYYNIIDNYNINIQGNPEVKK